MNHCIITGCRLIDTDRRMNAWGDLHKIEDCYVFNHANGVWELGIPFDLAEKTIRIERDANFMELASLIIIPSRFCKFNEAALEFVTKWGGL